MFSQLLKFGALIATGRFLKPRIKGLLWVAASWLVLWFVHSEYVNYVQLSGNTSFVLHATLIKTSFYALSIAVYVLRVERKLWPKPLKMPPAKPLTQRPSAPVEPVRPASLPANDDGFNFLRDKPTLKK
ncbi:MAG TPA: hypothetical protein GX696_03895 [Pseudomonadaceae bacterium]|nr:hypothetical protein [Pseudomonadaceae bacterium]